MESVYERLDYITELLSVMSDRSNQDTADDELTEI